ncbi:hypothetical protein AVEN_219164-1 [Araneus ventricosus]|uniref:Uncharacterized protein n=1 Tax=Araneus ventricosus TaxID=182803 RepID=A0A4Y2FQV9_ARAVE|nr:hypothetical protein AVEN_219164-1 [Araneus ventricosus]
MGRELLSGEIEKNCHSIARYSSCTTAEGKKNSQYSVYHRLEKENRQFKQTIEILKIPNDEELQGGFFKRSLTIAMVLMTRHSENFSYLHRLRPLEHKTTTRSNFCIYVYTSSALTALPVAWLLLSLFSEPENI